MSPELFFPKEFDLRDCRPTKSSDCYALGMVIYEVLGEQKPFSGYADFAVVVRIHKGKRPVRPRGNKGRWFTDSVWDVLEHCWRRSPEDRPSVEDVLHCLEEASESWTPSQTITDPSTTHPSTGNWGIRSDESTDEGQVSSSSEERSQSSRNSLSKGDANHEKFASTISLTLL